MDLDYIINNDEVIKAVIEVSNKYNIRVLLVGGFVRDLLLNKESNDLDFVVEGDSIFFAQEVIKLLEPRPKASIFKNFLTIHFEHKGNIYEFAGARKESYSRNSRNPDVTPGTIEDDIRRRDFTINAIAISLYKNNFKEPYDPFNGIQDLQDRIIKTPLDPYITFDDDPLRMLRAIRFAAQLNFTIDNKLIETIRQLVDRIDIVSVERITEEINKMLLTKKPSIAFRLLDETFLLKKILPEIHALKGVEKIKHYSHKDVFEHTLNVVDNIAEHSDSLWLRWAALLHDVGKPPTKKYVEGHGWTFHGHHIVGQKIATQIFHRLKLPLNEKLEYVKKLIGLHLQPIFLVEENVTDSAIRRLLFNAGNDIDDLMLLCRADITSKNEKKVATYLENFERVRKRMIEVEEKDKIRNWKSPISGDEIMKILNLKPSKTVGLIKDAIKEAILDGQIENNYEAAYKFMIEYAKKLNL